MIPMMVVPTLTRHDLLGQMLATVDYPVGHLVVIDNSGRGVDVPEGPWRCSTVLQMPVNFGVAPSWNLAVKMAHREPWVLVASDDVTWPAGALQAFGEACGEDRLVLSETWPHWCAFGIGMGVVHRVGLFDEGYFPAYFEDTDYSRRCARAGVTVERGPEVGHANSSTLNTPDANFAEVNGRTFEANRRLFEQDSECGFNPYRWRAQAWN
jgi:GT2 family glycosyltransferase